MGGDPYKRGGRWQDIRSEDINEYLKRRTGGPFTAKDLSLIHISEPTRPY